MSRRRSYHHCDMNLVRKCLRLMVSKRQEHLGGSLPGFKSDREKETTYTKKVQVAPPVPTELTWSLKPAGKFAK